MSRPFRIVLVVAAVVGFVAVSAGIARVLAAANAERDVAVDAVKAQVGAGGSVRILRVDAPSRVALGGRDSTARVVWRRGRRLPVVQCVRVRRSGNLLSGYDVRVLELDPPIDRESGC